MKLFLCRIYSALLIILFFIPNLASAADPQKGEVFNIEKFGAVGDGIYLNTKAIQMTINKAHEEGGGIVHIPPGTFLTGSIILKTGVELQLDENTILLGSPDPEHYTSIGHAYALIMSLGSQNISITGKGVIDGQGLQVALALDSLHHFGIRIDPDYNHRRKRPGKRPEVINFVECSGVKVTGITVKNGATWVTHFNRCDNLEIDNISIISDNYWNNDGIDINNCKNVRITNSFVNSADDGIVLKSTQPGFINENIYIADCTIRSSASALKFGTESHGGFVNVKIENIKIYDTYRSAIALETVDGGILENVDISNIVATNTGNAIFIRLGHRNTKVAPGYLRNISIRNMKVEIPFDRPDSKYNLRGPGLNILHNPFPASITGIPGHNVENLHLENIEISYPGRGNKGMAYIPLNRLKDVPENESDYPEFHMFGELPAWAFYVRHVKGLTMKNIRLTAREYDFRPAFVFDDVEDIDFTDISISKEGNDKEVVLNNVRKANISVDEELVKILENCDQLEFKLP